MSQPSQGVPRLIVGVGGSAGGLDAFKELLQALPADTGMAFVFVQHLSPEHDSQLGRFLAGYTSMAVEPAEDGAVLRPNTVYFIVPDTDVAVSDNRLVARPAKLYEGVRLPIDHLFISLASAGPKAAGIVLSGTGRDGSEGMRHLRDAGCVTLVQTPDSAEFDSMPRSAIDSCAADLILPIEEMPGSLDRFADLPEATRRGPEKHDDDERKPRAADDVGDVNLSSDVIERIAHVLSVESQVDPRVFKRSTLARRISRRLLLTGVSDLDRYLDRLEGDENERNALSRDLLIGVTEFFRRPAAFEALRNEVLRTWAGELPFRCWVAGCSTGEEAYSLAIELLDEIGSRSGTSTVQIFATDVDRNALAVARSGVYSSASLASKLSSRRLSRYFEALPGRGYRARPALRDCISFATHDLTRDPPFSRMDLVSCRNVLIYLRPEIQDQVTTDLHFALVENGCLFLGSSEHVGRQSELFDMVSPKGRIYRKRQKSNERPLDALPRFPARRIPSLADSEEMPSSRPQLMQVATMAAMPPTLIVDGNDVIRFTHGDLSDFVRLPTGEALTLDLGATLVDSAAGAVRSTVRRARSQDQRVTTTLARPEPVRVIAAPAPDLPKGNVVISFVNIEDGSYSSAAPLAGGDDTIIPELEAELARTRVELRTTVEDLEAANEELRAANEESQSMNEELQTSNAELEATTEELRSLNEELSVVNTELRDKVAEVQRAHDDLDNFFAGSNVPMLILDESLTVTRFTPAARQLLCLDPADEKVFVGGLTHEAVGADLVEEARVVLRDGTTSSRQIQLLDGRTFQRGVAPYRRRHRENAGVVVSFSEITDLINAIGASQRNEERLRLAKTAAGLGIYDFDPRTGRIQWDEAVCALWGIPTEAAITFELFLRGLHPDDVEATKLAVDKALDPRGDGRYAADYRVINLKDGETRWVHSNGQAFFEDGRPVRLVGTVQDVTARLQADRDQLRLAAIVDTSDDAIVSKTLDGTILTWNRGAERIFGYTASEMVGASIYRIIPDHLHDEERDVLRDLAQGIRREHFETERITKDGRSLIVDLSVSPLVDDIGRVIGASKIARDVTEARRLQTQLRETEERVRLAVEAGQLGIFDIDVATNSNRWSNRLKSLFGLPEDAEVANRPSDLGLIHPDDADALQKRVADWLDPNCSSDQHDEFRIIRADTGELRWLESRASAICEGEGDDRRVTRVLGAVMDITERKRAEMAVQESEARLRRLFDQAPALITIHQGPEHECIYSNPLHDRAVGNRPLIGLPLRLAMKELEGQGFFERFDRVFAAGEAQYSPVFEATFDRSGSGSLETGYFSQVLQPWFNPDGGVAGVMSFSFDVTAVVELQERVAESEERFRDLADHIDQLVWMARGDGEAFWFNKRWFDYTGTTLDEAKGWGWKRLYHPDHVNRVVEGLQSAFASQSRWEDVFPLRAADGRYRWFLSRAVPLRGPGGEVTRWFGTHTDVTEHRRAETRLRAADQRKDEFLAMLGHELRNPLSAIANASHLLVAQGASAERTDRLAGVITRQSSHMTRLVDGLLEVSRITRGKLDIELRDVDLCELVAIAVDDRRGQFETKGLEVLLEHPGEPVWVRADAIRLTQVLDNLLSNALKFTPPPGEVLVRLETADDEAAVTVRDTGVGVPSDLLDQIFEPFQQANQDLARSSGGLGLGLAVAHGIIELHGGIISASSAGIGLGAEFTFEIPRTRPEGVESKESVQSEGPQQKVVIVEDNVDAATTLAELIGLWGHEVHVYNTAGATLDYMSSNSADLVLCDIGLPDMSGYELAEKLRSLHPGDKPHLVAVTGYGQVRDRQRSLEAGFDAHLIKPLELDELRKILRSLGERTAARN